MQLDLTKGSVTKGMLMFALPMICSNLLQQLYNIADTLIVGRFIGTGALAAVGSAYTLMTFIISILLGMCMGSGAIFSIRFGEKRWDHLRENIFTSFVMIAFFSAVLNILSFVMIDAIMRFISVPDEVYGLMREYLLVVFCGIFASFLYNFFASLLRAVGNSMMPLVFLGVSAVLNIALDLVFVLGFDMGVGGAALATVISQWIAGAGMLLYTLVKCPELRPQRKDMKITAADLGEITGASVLTCLQQSVMNLGILMVQGLVNSFGTAVMAAFAAAVKIDAFAYMPLQDFGNAFSTFIAQNYGAREEKRIRKGIRSALCSMLIFISGSETEILSIGVTYLHVVGAFYFGIGGLFMLYGLYRALNRPGMSLVLTVISLGSRVCLAYMLSALPAVGLIGIWWAVPIGWILADTTGVIYYLKIKKSVHQETLV